MNASQMRSGRSLVGLLIAVITAVVVWWTQGDGADPSAQPEPGETPSVQVTETSSPTQTSEAEQTSEPTGSETTEDTGGDGGTDPETGLPVIQVSDLPPEAHDTLALIDSGGPYPHDEDGTTFQNREGILPDHPEGYYEEFTVETPGLGHRGAKRIVTGAEGEYYWTDDHYQSFSRIAR